MNDELTPEMHRRTQTLIRYINAMESGDVESVVAALQEAEQDQVLERMILQANVVYENEDHTAVQPGENAQLLQMLKAAGEASGLTMGATMPDQLGATYEAAIDGEVNDKYEPSLNGYASPLPIRRSRQERIQQAMQQDIVTSTIIHGHALEPTHPVTRLGRLSAFVQTLVAVLVMAALLAGFMALFLTHHINQGNTGSLPGAWRVVPSPNPGTTGSTLNGVATVAANDAWAVGSYSFSDAIGKTLIEHWNGKQWSVVQSPDPGPGGNSLQGVAAISANNVWAAGVYGSYNQVGKTLVEHWNGKQWSVVSSPNLPSSVNILFAITAFSANDIWAVGFISPTGETLVEHWNGTQWSIVHSPSVPGLQNRLLSVTAIAANDVWAAGFVASNGDTMEQSLIEHWNGTHWSIVKGIDPSKRLTHLSGITANSASDIWVVGYSSQNSGDWKTLVEHWNGTRWSMVKSPNPAGTTASPLYQIGAGSSNDLWAVGQSSNKSGVIQTLIEHWNGKAWTIVPSPNGGAATNFLWGIEKVPGSTKVWIVGYESNTQGGAFQTLTELYS